MNVAIYHFYLIGTGRTACAMDGLWRAEVPGVNCKRCLRAIAGAEKRKSPRYAPMDSGERERFDRMTLQVGACVEWQGSKNHAGYGMFLFRGRAVLAHRLALISSVGKLPAGSYACHRCGNPWCVNVRHLYVGRARLTADMVRRMRALSRTVSTAEVARRFGVTEGTARSAINGDTWKTA